MRYGLEMLSLLTQLLFSTHYYLIRQNQEWENEDDFGDELLDLIRRHKRVSTLPNSFFFA